MQEEERQGERAVDEILMLRHAVLPSSHAVIHPPTLSLSSHFCLVVKVDLIVVVDGGVGLVSHLDLEATQHIDPALVEEVVVLVSLGAPKGSLVERGGGVSQSWVVLVSEHKEEERVR